MSETDMMLFGIQDSSAEATVLTHGRRYIRWPLCCDEQLPFSRHPGL